MNVPEIVTRGHHFGEIIDVRIDNGKWWATCPACPGWTAAADDWDELYRLIAESHELLDDPHGWIAIAPVQITSTLISAVF